jgi:hypothetical protein
VIRDVIADLGGRYRGAGVALLCSVQRVVEHFGQLGAFLAVASHLIPSRFVANLKIGLIRGRHNRNF